MMLYYFVEFAGSFANIALLLLFIGRLFPKKEPVSRWFYAYVALLIAGQCALSLFPDWVTQRTIYLLVGGFLLALLFYEVRPWQAVFASGAFFTLIALVEVLAMLLIGLRIPDTEGLKIPHMGWNSITVNKNSRILKNIGSEPYVYFVHSYYVNAEDESIISAYTEYGQKLDIAVEKDNVFATQFHPEKSGETGMTILKNFIAL